VRITTVLSRSHSTKDSLEQKLSSLLKVDKCCLNSKNDFSQSNDKYLLAFSENVRRQVELDTQADGRYRVAGEGVRKDVERLREEMEQRTCVTIISTGAELFWYD
jgi:hypothetical protein